VKTGYHVTIRDNATGEVHRRFVPFAWDEASAYWWTDGNMGCDCNLEAEFIRAGGGHVDQNRLSTFACGGDRFTPLWAILPDGTSIALDFRSVA